MSKKNITAKEPSGSRFISSCKKSWQSTFSFRSRSKKSWTNRNTRVELNDNGEILNYDIATQCHSVFNNVRFILEDSGSSWENIVDVQVFFTNMKDDFKTYNKIFAEYFKENQPCRTTIEIKSLPPL